ncbi:HNH endonuclease [Candidatus Poribacteria bacterium]|nr:HNH endonuclease [Candidatus Poribacteria bacterium]
MHPQYEMVHEICRVSGCESPATKRGWCGKHYYRWRSYGDPTRRTKYDPNEIIVRGDACYIGLYNMSGKLVSRTVIDAEDLPKVHGRKWGLGGDGYPRTGAKGPKLHQVILGCRGVDHIDGDKLNNRKANLRPCNQTQNLANARVGRNTSGLRGVSRQKNAWVAQISASGKNHYLGRFRDKNQAALAYNEAALQLFGPFARLNAVTTTEVA